MLLYISVLTKRKPQSLKNDSRKQHMFTQFRVISENVSAKAKPQAFENYTTISSGLVTCFRRAMKVFNSS